MDKASLIARILASIPEQYTSAEVKAAKAKAQHHGAQRNALIQSSPDLAASHSMIKMAQLDAALAKRNYNGDLRLLDIPNAARPGEASDAAAAFYAPGYWNDTPIENAVYLQNIGSLVPGGGSALLEAIGRQYPDLPIVLESLDLPATREFYTRKGFVPQGDNVLIPGSSHENFLLPEGRRLFQKKAGGGLLRKIAKSLPQYVEGMTAKAVPEGGLSVVKEKGGSWLSGSVEDALRPLVRSTFRQYDQDEALRDLTPEESSMQQVINDWIQGPLTKYVKTRMATPEDEVRRLAEQGVLHMPVNEYESGMVPGISLKYKRTRAGFPEKDAAITPLGITWERNADRALEALPASVYQDPSEWLLPGDRAARDRMVATDAWLDTVPGTTPVHRLYASAIQRELGFPHLVDELRNALDPASGLPRHLRLTPEAVKQMSMEKAVRRVADINAWRAAQQAEASAKMSEGLPVLREYTENNPKGLRWVELKAPENLTPEQQAYYDKLISVQTDPQVAMGAARKYGRNPLADQLKYEGDTMGHCVGGYCDDVLSGRSRIFSLRDAKGEPHVTVEVKPGYLGTGQDGEAEEKLAKIIQIKGKQNRAPIAEYLPFVQDFVRRPPEGITAWGDVGDAKNAGLRRFTDAFNSAELRKLQEAGAELPEHGWLTGEELQALRNLIYPEGKRLTYDASGNIVGGFAAGGRVSTVAHLRDLIASLEAA